MKKIGLLIILLLVVVGISVAINQNDTQNQEVVIESQEESMETSQTVDDVNFDNNFRVNAQRSVVTWEGTKPGGSHVGTFALKSTQLSGDLTGELVIDMTTLESDSAMLDEHLKSGDFFEVEAYPNSQFVIDRIEDGMIYGQLTLLDQTQKVVTPVELIEVDGDVILESTFDIDRTDFGIIYGSGSFFDDLGDSLIADEVSVEVTLVLEAVEE